MLKERKCLICKYLIRDYDVFNHRCKAYPKGIPDDIFDDNSANKDCKSQIVILSISLITINRQQQSIPFTE